MKAVIFDFDGVIHDTFELCYDINSRVLESGLTRDEYKDFFNGNIYIRKEVTNKNAQSFFKYQNEAFKFLEIEKEVKKLLQKLVKNYSLFIISSNQESALDIYFNNNNIIHIFEEVLGAETHKSKVEKFKKVFKKYNLEPNDCVFVTDTLGDILEGNKVGIKTIAVDFGFHDRERLEKGKPYRIVSNFKELFYEIEKVK